MSSGLDSTAAFLKLLHENQEKNVQFFPIYLWWKTSSNDALKKEYENCHKLIKYMKEKYPGKSQNITELIKIEVPLTFYEETKNQYIKNDRKGYWPHFRNGIFIFSSISYILNYLKLKNYSQFEKITILVGFIGNEIDEDIYFINNMKKLLNEALTNPKTKKGSRIIEMTKKFDFYHPYLTIEDISYSIRPYFDIEKYAESNILKYTWSCWKNYDEPCKKCGGCKIRKEKYDKYKKGGGNLIDPYYEN